MGEWSRSEYGIILCRWIWDLRPCFGSIIPLCSVLIADVGYFTLRLGLAGVQG